MNCNDKKHLPFIWLFDINRRLSNALVRDVEKNTPSELDPALRQGNGDSTDKSMLPSSREPRTILPVSEIASICSTLF